MKTPISLILVTIFEISAFGQTYETKGGVGALQSRTTGDYNTAFGAYALYYLQTASQNIAIGALALEDHTDGDDNCAIGYETMRHNDSGTGNIAIGKWALGGTGADYNVAIGDQSANGHNGGDYNTFVGAHSSGSSGNYNTGIGATAAGGSGSFNTHIGSLSGSSYWGGSGNVSLGYMAGHWEHGSNKLYIDNSDTSTPLIYGDFSTDVLTVNGKFGIGTTSPRGILDADGPGDIYLVDDPNSGGTGQSIFIPGHIYISPFTNGSDWSYVQARRPNTSGTTHLRLRTTNSGSITEAMSILGNGYVGINATIPSYQLQVSNAYCDGNTWYNISDKNLKENFARISQGESILTKVMELPIQYWNYIGENTNRHIGPTAQDFYKIFGVGKNEKAISTVDESGIALAAIQELAYLVKEQQEIISTLLISKAAESEDNLVASETILRIHQNQPNPFQGDTKITMEIPYEVNLATLYVYDLHGKTIKKLVIAGRGSTSVTIEGGTLSSGIYLYTLIGDNRATEVKRMILTE